MSRPKTEAEYLASLVPPSMAARGVGRRAVLQGAFGLGAAATLAACGSSSGSGGGTTGAAKKATGTVTFGSNQSDAVPKNAIAQVVSDFQKANAGLTV